MPVGIYLLIGLLTTGVRIRLNKHTFFLAAACVGALCFLLVMNPELGMRRDWDAFAWTGAPLACALLFVMKKHAARRKLISGAAVISLWLLFPWLGVNASENRAVERYKRILYDETKLVAYGYGNLALHYEEQGRTDLEEWAHRQAAQREPENAKAVYLCGKKFLQHNKPDSAVRYLQKAVMLDPLDAVYWRDYGTALVYAVRHEEAIPAFHRSLSLDSTNSTAYASLGALYLNLRKWKLANNALTRAYEYGADDAWFYMCWAGVQMQSGEYKQAMHSLEKALRRGAPRERVIPLFKEAEAAAQKDTREK
jgi:tetratricopeptide (TPR) repeat protein